MNLKWNSIGCCCCSTDTPTEITMQPHESTEHELRRSSTSFWSTTYDRTVRTESYHQIMLRMEMLSQSVRHSSCSDSDDVSQLAADRLLQPSQATVETVLRDRSSCERPEIIKIAMQYFDSNQRASWLCEALLHSIHEARVQCREIKCMLSSVLPHPGQTTAPVDKATPKLLHIDRLCKLTLRRNPFSDDAEAGHIFADVWERYNTLSEEVAERRRVVGREVTILKRQRKGCVVGIIVAGAAVGVVVIAVVSTVTHAITMAGTPVIAVVMAMTSMHGRKHKLGDDGHKGKDGKMKAKWGRARYKEELRGLRMREVKLEALAKGSFTVKRMLDTLRCLVAGLQEDVERTRRLVEFGRAHQEQSVWVEQVAHHLHRSHLHLTQQLDNLEEQVVVCFLIINKARDWVFQEFSSPSSPPS